MSLKKLMKDKHVTQKHMAKRLGVHQTRISQMCCGTSEPSLRQATLMAEVLGCSVDEIAKANAEKNVTKLPTLEKQRRN